MWRRALCDRQREQHYTRFALLYWSRKLQERVFLHWSQYTIDKKRSNSKELEAISLYKHRLKTYTLRQWLISADFLDQCRIGHHNTNDRSEVSLGESTMSVNCAVQNVVANAFNHWRRFTQARSVKVATNRSAGSAIHTEIDNAAWLQPYHTKPREKRNRPQPKVPKFLTNPSKPEVGNAFDPSQRHERV